MSVNECMKAEGLGSGDFIWPSDPREIGLTANDVSIVEQAIRTVRATLAPDAQVFIKGPRRIASPSSELPSVPKTLIIARYDSLVVLKIDSEPSSSRGALSGSSGTCAYNPDTGDRYAERKIISASQEALIGFIAMSCMQEADSGFVHIVYCNRHSSKRRYFEKQYEGPLSAHAGQSCSPFTVSPEALFRLKQTLEEVHSLTYTPSAIQSSTTMCRFSREMRCYHGDISPNSVVCEKSGDDETVVSNFRFIEWGRGFLQDQICGTTGWLSPEYVKFLKSPHREDPSVTMEINARYGTKKDVWAFALLAASMWLGYFSQYRGSTTLVPPFSFLKLREASDGSMDDSAVADVRQEEIDAEIDRIIQSIDRTVPDGELRILWWRVIKQWLQVDPDKRPDLKQFDMIKLMDTQTS